MNHVVPGFEFACLEPSCPDVFRIELMGGENRIAKVATVYRHHGEDDSGLWSRVQAAARELVDLPGRPGETVGWIRAMHNMTVERAMKFDDRRENQRLFLRWMMNSDLAEIRVMGAIAAIRFYGMDQP